MPNFSDMVGLGNKIKSIEIQPDKVTFDSDDSMSDAGVFASIVETVDFEYDVAGATDGSIWFQLPILSGWRDDQPLLVDMNYAMNGSDSLVARMRVTVWKLVDGSTPSIGSSDDESTYDITNSTDNTGKIDVISPLVTLSSISTITSAQSLNFRVSRVNSASEDTYTGTVQLISLKIYQSY